MYTHDFTSATLIYIICKITIYATCQGGAICYYLKKYFPQANISIIENYQEMPIKWGIYSKDYSNFDELTENDNINIICDWEFSTYDKNFHNFEFSMNCNDDAIKNII